MKNQIFLNCAALGVALMGSVGQVSAQKVEKSSRAGSGVYEAVFNAKDSHVYVTGAGLRSVPGSAAIFKIDPKSLEIVDSIPLADNPPFGIGINNKTGVAYTSNTRTNSVSAIDLKSKKVLATINAGTEKSHTREVLVDEKNNVVYVSNVGDPSDIWVIDGKTNKFVKSIPNLGKTTTGMAFSKDGKKLFVTTMGTDEVSVVDIASGKVEKSFKSGGEGVINIVRADDHLILTNQKSGTVTVLDAATGDLIKSIPTGAGAIGIAYDKVKNRIYSANRQTGTTTVIDAKTYEVLADLPTGSHPNYVTINPKNGEAFVINKTKGGRPQPGEPAPPVDTNGDTITKIN